MLGTLLAKTMRVYSCQRWVLIWDRVWVLWTVSVWNPLDKNNEGIFMSKVGVVLG